MTILAFDTSAAHCAAALLCGDRVTTRVEEMAKGQAERLVPMMEELLAASSVDWADLSAIAVGVGPGNFTGIRISVALARGLALGLGVPAIGVTGFEAVQAATTAPPPYSVVLDAPRGQFYVQQFGEPEGEAHIANEVGGPVVRLSDISVDRLVEAIARVGLARSGATQPRPKPFYLRGADAAPPSDLPPAILP
ncbi:MAG: tRNA (adenosine(37)-N6)-threonylcarbamoyltransferase complex dimerization subunit type 1 TsaB [bacterium]